MCSQPASQGAAPPASIDARPDANLAERLRARAREAGWWDRPAFRLADRTVTHGEVHEGAANVAGALAQLGVEPGDRVVIAAADGVELVWAFLAAARLGAVAVLVNPRLPERDHRLATTEVAPRLVVCEPGLEPRFAPVTACATSRLATLAEESAVAPVWPVRPDDVAYAQFTSGTTGQPKAALHRHRDGEVYVEAFARPVLRVEPDDVLFSASKLYFAYGLGNSLFFSLLSGASAVLLAEHPTADRVAAAAARHRPTIVFAVPTLYANLLGHGDAAAFGGTRLAVSAGEALVPALAERITGFLGCPVLDGLGSTEVGQTFCSNAPDALRPGTVGRALPPYEVAVHDDDGAALPAGREGHLVVRGPTTMVGYLGRPDATQAVRLAEGWLRTGDRARVDADGFLHLLGRADDIENVGGIKLAPLEIERVLMEHPDVAEVAVAALTDVQGASQLHAFVVARPGADTGPALADSLLAATRAQLAAFKVPKQVRFVDALPRTPTGKLRRFLLRQGSW